MPESKKRTKKKNHEVSEKVYKNPLKKTWGKTVVVLLAIAFVLGLVATTIFVMVSYFMR